MNRCTYQYHHQSYQEVCRVWDMIFLQANHLPIKKSTNQNHIKKLDKYVNHLQPRIFEV